MFVNKPSWDSNGTRGFAPLHDDVVNTRTWRATLSEGDETETI